MIDSVITYEQLKDIFGGSSITEVVIRLEREKIPYKLGKRGCPITTFSALNYSMGITDYKTQIISDYSPIIEIE